MAPDAHASLIARTNQAIAELTCGVGTTARITRDLWLLRELRDALIAQETVTREAGR